MNDLALESFINFCDDMEIVEEGFISSIGKGFKKLIDTLVAMISKLVGLFKKKKSEVGGEDAGAEGLKSVKELVAEIENVISKNNKIIKNSGIRCNSTISTLITKNPNYFDNDYNIAEDVIRYTGANLDDFKKTWEPSFEHLRSIASEAKTAYSKTSGSSRSKAIDIIEECVNPLKASLRQFCDSNKQVEEARSDCSKITNLRMCSLINKSLVQMQQLNTIGIKGLTSLVTILDGILVS